MRIKHINGAAGAIHHEGATFEPDEHGYFRLPFDLAERFLKQPFWEAEPVEVVLPEPVAIVVNDGEDEDGDDENLTPAEKGARTKAANAAKAAAEAAAS